MSTQQSFIDHVVEQAGLGDRLVSRKMFGEVGFHLDGKFVALACDNSLFIKTTQALADNGLDLPLGTPYPGAKPYPVGDELLDDPGLLHKVLLDTAGYLPEPKTKKATGAKGKR